MMNKVQVTDKTYWVGKTDFRQVPFHRLVLEKGTTYNAYFLDTEKPTLIDTVDMMFAGEFVRDLPEIIDPAKLKYIVVNHVEPDHAGAVGALIVFATNATIVTTQKGKEMLAGMYRIQSRKFLVVKDGDTLDIGGKTLQFFETPYLHTEETMITYCLEDKVLYPCDLFSTHIANNELFNDLAPADITEDFKGYYQLIMHPHRSYVRKMLEKLATLDIRMIAPAHGYILRANVNKYINLYDEMSRVKPGTRRKKALVLYSSLTGRTGKVADNIALGLTELGVEVTVANDKSSDLSSIKDLALEADAILFGSSTKYGDMTGNLEDILQEIVKLDLSNKLVAAFGSYGWSGEGIELVNDYLKISNATLVDTSYLIKSLGVDNVQLPLRIQFTPDEDTKARCAEAGRIIGELLISA